MAVCDFCAQEMTAETTNSCSQAVEFPDGTVMAPVRFSHDATERCHDCNVMPGAVHHPGCDMERCPRCGGQLIGCGCLDPETASPPAEKSSDR